MRKVLFFTPHGTLTGSEVLLWHFLDHFDRQHLQASLYCERNGHLLASTPPDVACFVSPFLRGGLRGLTNKVIRQVGLLSNESAIRRIHQQVQPDCWYLNTILMAYLVPLAKKLGVKTVLHIHELNSVFEAASHDDMARAMQQADLVIGVNDTICDFARTMGAAHVVQQRGFVDLSKQLVDPVRSRQLRERLGIAPGTHVWLMIGTPTHRKGFDFLPALARQFSGQPCHFLWMGYTPRTGLTYLIEKQLDALGLTNVTLLEPQTDEYFNYIQLADSFLLCSREDPFPLVMIEAASLAKPIVASADVGAAEFLLPGMGELVPQSTVPHFIAAMQRVMDHPEGYDKSLLIRRSHEFSAEVQMRRWQETILSAWQPAAWAGRPVLSEG